jgi:hypothetical protein
MLTEPRKGAYTMADSRTRAGIVESDSGQRMPERGANVVELLTWSYRPSAACGSGWEERRRPGAARIGLHEVGDAWREQILHFIALAERGLCTFRTRDPRRTRKPSRESRRLYFPFDSRVLS